MCSLWEVGVPTVLMKQSFLSDYYKTNRSKGMEIIALAYELTTDIERSIKSVAKFQKLLDVQYPMLITGVAARDEKKTEKTLPQLTAIGLFQQLFLLIKREM